MANFTREAIRKSFLKLLDERPLAQIKVKDIAADCGINRNTFYYYFQDIPMLIEDLVMEAAEKIVEKYPTADTMEDFFHAVIDFLLERKKAFLHIYNSVSRELFEQYLWQVCERIVDLYVHSVLGDRKIRESDLQIIRHYLKCVSFGIVSGWLQSGMSEEIRQYFTRIYEVKKGTVEEMIHRFEEK